MCFQFCFPVLQVSTAYLKQLIKTGDVEKLEQAVLDGQGKKLMGENSGDLKTRNFLTSIPALMVSLAVVINTFTST